MDEFWYSGVFRVADYVSQLKIQKFELTDPIWLTKIPKSYSLGMRFDTWDFFASPITNPSSTFRNSKCQMQYGRAECKQQKLMPRRFLYGIPFSGSLIMNLTLDFWYQGIQDSGRKFEKLSDYAENL